jgi:hypothetical protein
VYNEELVASYDTFKAALDEGIRRYGLEGNFLIHQIFEEEPTYLIYGVGVS